MGETPMYEEEEALRVLRAQSGDRGALNELFRAMQEPLFRYLVGLVGRRELAEDVLQEAFMRIYQKLGWLRNVELFRPWAYRITTRIAFRRLRQERDPTALSPRDAPPNSIPSPPNPQAIPR